jgi:23S rRNA (guanosine2251-2'-O)-methyltransferase
MEENMEEKTWLEGRISVEAALLGENRLVDTIYILEGRNHSFKKVLHLAKAAKVPVKFEGNAFFAEQARGKSHGGVLALVGSRKFLHLNELPIGENNSLVVMLDGVEDPFNFGQAVRGLFASGVSGLVVRKRNWLSAAGVVTRSSAGASELIPTAVVDSALDAARFFREHGMLIACTARKSAVSIFDSDLTQPLFLLIGGEKRGITRSFLDQADLRLQIPYGRTFEQSLGVTASTAVLAFEIMRQRALG